MKPMFKGLMLAGSLLAGGQAVAGDLIDEPIHAGQGRIEVDTHPSHSKHTAAA